MKVPFHRYPHPVVAAVDWRAPELKPPEMWHRHTCADLQATESTVAEALQREQEALSRLSQAPSAFPLDSSQAP